MAGTRFRSLIYITRPRAQSQVSTQKINALPEIQSCGAAVVKKLVTWYLFDSKMALNESASQGTEGVIRCDATANQARRSRLPIYLILTKTRYLKHF